MFITDTQGRHPLMSSLMGEGQDVWTYVRVDLFVPWFVASYRIHEDGNWVGSSILLADDMQVETLIKQHGSDVQVQSIGLIRPKQNATQFSWEMVAVASVWRATRPQYGPALLAFDLVDGTRHARTTCKGADWEMLVDLV